MAETKNIKWCAIQPLTGGMYLGAEKAIGHRAEFIISFPGIADVSKINKETGEVVACGNEYHLLKYLEKKNDLPDYRIFNRAMFDASESTDVELLEHDKWSQTSGPLDYSDMDICIAVPVCSGLSTVTVGDAEMRATRNCNMMFIARYAMNVIRPKVYVFENAPAVTTGAGATVRRQLEDIAAKAGYSVSYYKTDTRLHDNCQTRKRTFIYFYRHDTADVEYPPTLQWENIQPDFDEFMSRIPADASLQNETMDISGTGQAMIKYLNEKVHATNWHEKSKTPCQYIIKENLVNDFLDYSDTLDIPEKVHARIHRYVNHCVEKLHDNKGYWDITPFKFKKNRVGAIMFRTMQYGLHPNEDRLLNMRECLHFMGHPADFELQGDYKTTFRQIGQNVPVRTAQWIVSEAIRTMDLRGQFGNESNVRAFDNINQKEMTL